MRDSDIDALSADGAQEAQPRTVAGRKWAKAMDCYHCTQKIVAIEAEAAEPAPLDDSTVLLEFGQWLADNPIQRDAMSEAFTFDEPDQYRAVVDEFLAAGDKGSDR